MTAVGPRNLARLAEETHERRGDYDALWFEGNWFRSGELFDRGARLARGLVELGVEPGDRVIVMMENSPDVAAVYHAIARAGGVVTPVIHEFLRRAPGVEIREGYGLTETSALVSTNPPDRVRYGTVGLPVPGTQVRIVDGEVCVRSELVTAGYWNEPGLTAETIKDGWLYTGDMGRLDEDGYLTILDRKKDLIIRGGFNVFPRDVEEALLEHPAIATACVVGRPHDLHGEEVVAFVTLTEEIAPDELVAFGRQRLGGYKYPREIHVLDALPLTPIGKADRKALRELLTVQGGTTR